MQTNPNPEEYIQDAFHQKVFRILRKFDAIWATNKQRAFNEVYNELNLAGKSDDEVINILEAKISELKLEVN